MRLVRWTSAVLAVCLVATTLVAQTGAAVAPVKASESKAEIHRGDIPDLNRETQLGIRAKDYAGLIWWIPFEFWLDAAAKNGNAAQAEQNFKAIKQYTVVFVFASKVSSLGAFDFVAPEQIQRKVFIRDSSGNEYAPIENISDDARNLAGMLKPVLANAMGKAGENSVLLFFPAVDKKGRAIADAKAEGSFSVVLKDMVGVAEDVYEWRLPLTSISAPKFCPIGKERVNANWKYCPFHGAPLDGAGAAASGK